MKIKRFVAKDMRSALEQSNLELGADAVIMSNKKIPEGVELMAAIDNHQQTSSEALAQSNAAEASMSNSNTSNGKEHQRELGHDVVTLKNTAAHQQNRLQPLQNNVNCMLCGVLQQLQYNGNSMLWCVLQP